MRRATSVVALSLMLIVMVGTAVSAKGQGGNTGTVTYSAAGGTGPAGGSLPLTATVHNAAPGTTFSAVALVHFATGDVSVTFGPGDSTASARTTKHQAKHGPRHHHKPPWHRRHPRRHPPAPQPGVDLTATTQVPITGEDPWGTVPIDVTFTYGRQTVTVHTTGLVDGY